MDFAQAREYIDSLNRFGSVLGLDNIKHLMGKLGNPQEKLQVIHVAGTNGKGSTIAFLSRILTEAGYKVGKYTSPVVFDYLEKYQINEKNISQEDFAAQTEKVKSAVESMVIEGLGQPTIFEVETAMAYEYFREKSCDIAIIETGMGGDTDATNVCSRVLASVIVSVSLDHTQFLGKTLKKIAEHKAGIIKEECPVVLYHQSDEVMNTVRAYADRLNAPVTVAKRPDKVTEPFDYTTAEGTTYSSIRLGLKGVWQVNNACVALEVVGILKRKGYVIPDKAVLAGLENAVWHGRFEIISDEPCIIIDGAHNPGAAKLLAETLEMYYSDTRFVYIMGVLADKDFTEVIELMAKRAVKIITVTPDNGRALAAQKLAEAVSRVNENVMAAASIEEALDMAKREYEDIQGNRAILAFGSLSYLGRLREICLGVKER